MAGPLSPDIPNTPPPDAPTAPPPDSGTITSAAPATASNILSSPQGFYGPGAISNTISLLGSKLGINRSPKEVYDRTTPTLEGASQVAGILALPETLLAGPLRRIAAQAALSGGGAALAGKTPGSIGLHTLLGGASGAAGEALMAPAQLAARTLSAKTATQGYKQATKQAVTNAENTNAFNKGFTKTLNETEQAGYEQATKEHAEAGAKSIMGDLKKTVPALKNLPDDTKGLLEAIYGQGPQKVMAEYDTAMKAAQGAAKGKFVDLPVEVANALKLKGTGEGMSKADMAEIAKQLGIRKGENAAGIILGKQNAANNIVKVDAADLIDAITGKPQLPKSIRYAADRALDEADLGIDPAAKQAYKFFRGIEGYLDKTKGLQGEQLNPQNILKGFTDTKTVNQLRNRGIGDINRGPLQAIRGGPTPPTPRPMPAKVTPEPVTAPDIRTIPNPLGGHPYMLGLLGGGLAHGLGAGMPGHVAGVSAGYAAGRMMPKEIVTRAPLSPAMTQTLQDLPSLLATLSRLGIAGAPTQPQKNGP